MSDEYTPTPDTTAEPEKLDDKTQERHDKVYREFCKRAQASLSHSSKWRSEARELFDMVSGARQWALEDEMAMEAAQRPSVVFNVMGKFIDAVVGLQINNRQEIRVYPRRNGVAALSENATGALAWCRDGCDAVFEETDAGHDCLLTGMGWSDTYLEDQTDPDGVIVKARQDPLEQLWDSMARKKNLSDGRYIISLRRYGNQQYKDLFGRDPPQDVSFAGMNDADMEANLRVIYAPQDYKGNDRGDGGYLNDHTIVALYQWYEVEDAIRATAVFPPDPSEQPAQPQAGPDGQPMPPAQPQPESKTFTVEQWDKIKPLLDAAGYPNKSKKIKRRCYYKATVGGGQIEGKIEKLAYQDGFTLEAITGKRDRNTNTWYGLGRALVDPQKWVNKFFSSIIWQMSINPKGGLLIEESAAPNLSELKKTWADPSQVSVVGDGAIANGRLKEKPASNYPAGLDKMMNFALQALPEVSGLNAEILGLVSREQSGVVEAQRKQGALSIIAWYFDALHRHYKSSGRLTLALIRDFIADDRLIRVAGAEGAKYVPLTKKALQDDFDFVVDEAPTSVNMRDRLWQVLKEVIPLATALGVPIPKETLDYMPIPDDLAQKWKQAATPDPEAQKTKLRALLAEIALDEEGAKLKTAQAEQIKQETPAKVDETRAKTAKTAAEAGKALAAGDA